MAIRPKTPVSIDADRFIKHADVEACARPSRMLGALLPGVVGLMLLSSAGCHTISSGVGAMSRDFHQCIDESMVDYRNRALAEKAWIRIRRAYFHNQYHRDIKAGFVAGYLEVAGGGDGCTPALAPEEYWGWRYQSPLGQAAVNAWFQGFPLGAKAADQDGVGYFRAVSIQLTEPMPVDLSQTSQEAMPSQEMPPYPNIDAVPDLTPNDESIELIEPGLGSPAVEQAEPLEVEENIIEVDEIDTGADSPNKPDSVLDQVAPPANVVLPVNTIGTLSSARIPVASPKKSEPDAGFPNTGWQMFLDGLVGQANDSVDSTEDVDESDELSFSFE